MTPKGVVMERWGIPDWECADAYPEPSTDKLIWRWEFMRRRPDYRASWERLADGAQILIRGKNGTTFEGEISWTDPDENGFREGKTVVKKEGCIPYVTACKSAHAGSIPAEASNKTIAY